MHASLVMAGRSEHEVWGWETFFEEVGAFLRDAGRQFGNCTEDYAYYAVERLEVCAQNVSHLRDHLEAQIRSVSQQNRAVVSSYKIEMEELLECLRALFQEWRKYLEERERVSESIAYRVSVEHNSGRGRPRFKISRDQLEYLRSLSFSWKDIASLLGVSRMTIFRRRQEFGMLEEPSRTLDQHELRTVLVHMRRELPQLGEKMVIGRLRSMGYHITRVRVRAAVRVTDPIITALRWPGGLTARRPYSVPGPNSLWHIGKHMHDNIHYVLSATTLFLEPSLSTFGWII